jgi:hypothetical protein
MGLATLPQLISDPPLTGVLRHVPLMIEVAEPVVASVTEAVTSKQPAVGLGAERGPGRELAALPQRKYAV